ncbi:MAG: hypothetical protein ABI415_01200 [Flavitalea sp.]
MRPNSSISNFKEFILRLLLPSIFILAIICLMLNYIFERNIIIKSENSGAYKVNRVLNGKNQFEIPIFGSSRALNSYIPDSISKYAFNYGLNGAQDDIWLFFLKKELAKTRTSPIIINFDFNGLDSAKGDLQYYLYNSNDAEVRKIVGDDWQPYFNVPMVKYFGRVESYITDYLKEKTELTRITNRGASLYKLVQSPKAFAAILKERRENGEVFRNSIQLRNELFRVLKEPRNREIYFVIAPYNKTYIESQKNVNDAKSFLNELRTIPRVTVFDYSEFDLPDEDFFNTSHVNYKGAQIFSAELRRRFLATADSASFKLN